MKKTICQRLCKNQLTLCCKSFFVVICDCEACRAKSIVLHKAAINIILCQVPCVIYMLKLRTLSMHQCAFVKKDSFLSMYVIQATGEENYLSASLLEPTDFVLQVIFCGYMPL